METNYRSDVRSYSRRAVLLGVGGIGVTALAGCLTSGDGDGDDWPMSRATAANTGYTSASGPVDALEADWEWSFDPEDEEVRNATYSSPVVVDDAVLATCNVVTGTGTELERSSHLVALEAGGSVQWTVDVPSIDPSPVVADGVVYVRDSVRENTVTAHDAEDGTKLTDGDLNGNALDPAVAHGRYYYGSDDGITALTE
ncbi:PQQ-binding-like beta-propeller repeat protein [Halomontanus rarus]|uniref:PQQ-binding-like beta-propeller repeat protein n=1 Tax=Halomontanus rarus TaxID=3034020 RepID=UPI0023E8D3AF|nr:PQQ-binding-like beta-propeller repeat protein [Halovivax sp. TS33]